MPNRIIADPRPIGFGPAESGRLTGTTTIDLDIDRVITYSYDDLYRLTGAGYSTGESYAYEYDAVGNRLKQIIDGDTTTYLYDAANRLEKLVLIFVSATTVAEI